MSRRSAGGVAVVVACVLLAGAALAQAQKAASTRSARRPAEAAAGFGVRESLSGRILMVVPDQNLLIVTGPNDVPYDFKVTPKTQIVSGSSHPTLTELKGQEGRAVVVEFVPERDGNYARRIEVRG
jgi:hypothetical protein